MCKTKAAEKVKNVAIKKHTISFDSFDIRLNEPYSKLAIHIPVTAQLKSIPHSWCIHVELELS